MDSVQKIPVFVYPNSLKFYLGSRATHKQLLTLYNPYEFPVTFKGKKIPNVYLCPPQKSITVLSTAPQKYLVVDPEGSIGPQSCVDIAVRHNVPLSAHCNVTDKFRISMQDHTTKKVEKGKILWFFYYNDFAALREKGYRSHSFARWWR